MKWLNWLWLVLIPAAALAVVLLLIAPEEKMVWTTDSPAALDAFERCLEAEQKIYFGEAAKACAEALDKDPGFVMAKLERARFLLMSGETVAAEKQFDELKTVKLSRLNPRERFLLQFRLAAHEGRRDEAQKLLDGYLAHHPDDPWAISIRCAQVWDEKSPEAAEGCYQRLLDADANWVDAQNRLGYLAMARGRFDQAEERFETYHYLAPDQANPHDSLGELLTLIGRWDDAEAELRKAIAVRPDFCASYDHLVRLFEMEEEFDRARETVSQRQEQPACAHMPPSPALLGCSIDASELRASRRWEDLWQLFQGECGKLEGLRLLVHLAAVKTGRGEQALEIEHTYELAIEEAKDYPEVDQRVGRLVLARMQGTRLRAAGKPAEAAETLAQADRQVPYWQPDNSSFLKLYNQVDLAAALAEAGRTAEARRVLDKVKAVNARVLAHYDGPPLPDGAGASAKGSGGAIGSQR